MEYHFIRLLEKIHRPPEYLEMVRLQVFLKIHTGIPFLKRREFIFFLNILAKIASPASLLHPCGAAREVIVWDNSNRFSERTFMRMMARIIKMVVAS